jgi:tRNA A-37 threonylcarbamoyl transferase component Bud32
MGPRDVFISHSSGDAELARELRAVLEAAGYSCWMAPDDIVGTRTWTEQILSAIADSKVMVVLVSGAAQASEHVSREVNLALGRKRAVLPVRIENVPPEGPLEYLLSLVQRLDAFPPPMATHGPRILRRLEAILERPQTTPLPDRPGDETGPMDKPGAPAEPAPEHEPAPSPGPRRTPKSGPEASPNAPDDAAATATPEPEPGSSPVPEPEPPPVPFPAPTPAPPPGRRSSADIGPGSTVGAFTIESQLGEGGMATVYRARQDEPRRLVALKVIRADHAANATYRLRFLEEKETLAALEHPSIVPIYAAGESDGVLFIAMRLVDGPDLQARIKRQGHLSLRETVQILEPIADAVDYAHATGVVHRDLKPSNVILDRDNRPYLTDFGLGKRLEVDSQVSLPGMAIGTLDYMAPEQFTGKADSKLAPAIDIYALGCVAFQCLTGQAPFVRETPDQLMYAHAHEEPPRVTSIRPEYPPVVDAIFAKALAKDPAARYGSARELIADLDRVAAAAAAQGTSRIAVPDAGPARQARSWVGRNTALAVGGGAVALVAAVVLGAGLIFSPGSSPRPTEGGVATLAPTARATILPATQPPRTPTPTPTPDPNAFPNTFEEQLLALQPSPLVNTALCTRFTLEMPTALATIACPARAQADWQGVFSLYADPAAVDAAYAAFQTSFGVARSETSCFDGEPDNRNSNSDWWFELTPDVVEGRLACYDATEGTFVGVNYVWTFGRLHVMARWLTTDYESGLEYFGEWVSGANTRTPPE